MNDVSNLENLRLILNHTTFNNFRNEFSFELSNELRKKFGGFSFKKKINNSLSKEKTMTFDEKNISSYFPTSERKFFNG